MTKTFEEELMTNEKIIEMINKLPNEGNKFELINSFCDALKEVFKNYHSDEEFQLLLRDRDTLKQGNDNLFKDHLELVKENKELKSQLEQQPLPEVPECVGKELYNIDFNYWIENKMTFACFTARTLNWLEQHRGDWNIEYYICKLRFGGFTVEKPQQKRYEVKLLSGEPMHFNPIGNPKNIKDYRFSFGNYAGWKTKFTKSELGKIMGGAIYKGCILPDGHEFSSDCKPWINPLIELVSVEDGE